MDKTPNKPRKHTQSVTIQKVVQTISNNQSTHERLPIKSTHERLLIKSTHERLPIKSTHDWSQSSTNELGKINERKDK